MDNEPPTRKRAAYAIAGDAVAPAAGAKRLSLRALRADGIRDVVDINRSRSRFQAIARIVATLLLVLLGLYTLQDFLGAIAWAVVFAIATWPLYRRARNSWPVRADGGNGVVLPLVFTCVVALVFILPLALVAVPIEREAQAVFAWIDEARRRGLPVPGFLWRLPFASHLVPLWRENLGDPGDMSVLLGRLAGSGIVGMSGHLGGQVLHRLLQFCFTLLTLFFLFRDGEALTRRMLRGSGRLFGPSGERVGRQVIASVKGTVDGLVLVGLGEGAVFYACYMACGVPRPALFGVVTAFLSMVPFGAALAFWIAGASLLVLGHVARAIAVVGIGLLITFVADHFVRPALIGGATRLPFLWVLFGILGGIETWGLLGLFVGPAIMAVLILLWRESVGDDPARVS